MVDVSGTTHAIRRQRGGSVQTPIQYYFVHQALLDYASVRGKVSMFGEETPRDVGIVRASAKDTLRLYAARLLPTLYF